ncbi:MAG: 3-hydroxyacyl-ACP dehydratase FabZ [Victivallaceae bacterium]
MAQVLDLNAIKKVLPYRYPMLMLDRVEIESETRLNAVKALSINEKFFQGHFPHHPIMPGVLQVEAMKQLAQIAVWDKLDPAREKDLYMRLLEKVKFRKPNLPGDRVKIEVEVESIVENEAVVVAKCSNKEGVTCQARITLALRDKQGPTEMPAMFTEFDKCASTQMDVTGIMQLVPHRYPFLLIDHIAKIDGDNVFAVKNVTGNEDFFRGLPEDFATLPESLMCEIAAQSGCASVLARPENKGKLGYFMSIDRAESLAPVFPGDQFVCNIVLPPGQSKFGKGTGYMTVGDKVVFKITLMFAIVDA